MIMMMPVSKDGIIMTGKQSRLQILFLVKSVIKKLLLTDRLQTDNCACASFQISNFRIGFSQIYRFFWGEKKIPQNLMLMVMIRCQRRMQGGAAKRI